MFRNVNTISTILIAFLVIIFYAVIYSLIFITKGNPYYSIGPIVLMFYCYIFYLVHKQNKIAIWFMIFTLFIFGMGGLIFGSFIPISHLFKKITFIVVGIFFVFGAFKLCALLPDKINKILLSIIIYSSSFFILGNVGSAILSYGFNINIVSDKYYGADYKFERFQEGIYIITFLMLYVSFFFGITLLVIKNKINSVAMSSLNPGSVIIAIITWSVILIMVSFSPSTFVFELKTALICILFGIILPTIIVINKL